jgi:hypothetical protein
MSVKGLNNIFDLDPKWARTLPSGISQRPPQFVFVLKLEFDNLLSA